MAAPGLLLCTQLPSMGFPGGTSGKEPACQHRKPKRLGFNPWMGRSPGGRAWQPTPVFSPGESHGERSLVGYSSIFAWRIPWREEPGGLQSIGSHTIGHDWSDLACKANENHFKSEWSKWFHFTGQPQVKTVTLLMCPFEMEHSPIVLDPKTSACILSAENL